jgi:hypothetical protein
MSARCIARVVAAGTALASLPVSAFAAGGEVLPFNQAFDTVTSNLTGPTAKAVIIAAFFAGIVGVMVSHDRPWMKNIGTVIAGGALLVGVPSFLDTLGISAAEGDFNWRLGFLVASGVLSSALLALLFVARGFSSGLMGADADQRTTRSRESATCFLGTPSRACWRSGSMRRRPMPRWWHGPTRSTKPLAPVNPTPPFSKARRSMRSMVPSTRARLPFERCRGGCRDEAEDHPSGH